jgi:tetratricopeptide (TPR) repeat protein
VKEVSRLIMTLIEMGSLYRDRLRPTKEQRENETAIPRQINQAHYREALVNLNEAIRLAKEKQLNHLLVDAYINLAWTHFHAGQLEKVQETFDQVKQSVDSRYFIKPAQVPDRNDEELVDLFWAMRQLSKLETVRGQMGLQLFEQRINELKTKIQNEEKRHKAVQKDTEAQKYLKEAAEAYILALGYANILSPGSRMFDYLLDDFYYLLRKFNHTELDSFHNHVQSFKSIYSDLESIEILDRFLHEFFGLPEDVEEFSVEA